MGETNEKLRLEVMICTYGREGIGRIASLEHPRIRGVRYLISWQTGGASADEVPRTIAERGDMKVASWDDRGLSRNRNHCLDLAIAPAVLISDDDMSYRADELEALAAEFERRPEADLITFRHKETEVARQYPEHGFLLSRRPKNYSICSVDMAFRPERVRARGLRFNEYFGADNYLASGEDTLFFYDMINSGLQGVYLPLSVGCHHGISTGMRDMHKPAFIAAKGAIISHLHPLTWPLRLLMHVRRETGENPMLPPEDYIKAWLSGVAHARRHKVFSRGFTRSRAGNR